MLNTSLSARFRNNGRYRLLATATSLLLAATAVASCGTDKAPVNSRFLDTPGAISVAGGTVELRIEVSEPIPVEDVDRFTIGATDSLFEAVIPRCEPEPGSAAIAVTLTSSGAPSDGRMSVSLSFDPESGGHPAGVDMNVYQCDGFGRRIGVPYPVSSDPVVFGDVRFDGGAPNRFAVILTDWYSDDHPDGVAEAFNEAGGGLKIHVVVGNQPDAGPWVDEASRFETLMPFVGPFLD